IAASNRAQVGVRTKGSLLVNESSHRRESWTGPATPTKDRSSAWRARHSTIGRPELSVARCGEKPGRALSQTRVGTVPDLFPLPTAPAWPGDARMAPAARSQKALGE